MRDLSASAADLRGLPRELALVLMTAFGGALLGLSIPIASGILVDQVIPEADLQGMGGPGLSRLAVMCGFLMILALATAAFQAIQRLMVLRIEGRISATLIPAVWERLLRLPSRFFAGFSSGDLALRAMGLSEVFKRASGAVVTSIVTGVFSLFNLALLYAYSWRLALITTMLLGLLLLVTSVLLAGRLRFESSIGRIDGSLSGLLLELFGGMITLRSSGAEGRALARWAGRFGERLRLADPVATALQRHPPVAGRLPDPDGDGHLHRRRERRPRADEGGAFPRLQHGVRQPGGGGPGRLLHVDRRARHAPALSADPADPRGESRVPRGRDRAGAAGRGAGPESRLVPLSGAGPGRADRWMT